MTNFNLSARRNVKIGIDMVDFCAAGQRLKMPIAKIRGVDEVESAGSGFSLASKRPKILFEGHLFYAELRRKGLHIKAQMIDPTICYPKWTKAHYIGRDGEYARLAKATEICHALGVTDGIALRCASWGRYQILGSNFIACGYDSVEQMVEAMFLDEDNHLEAFCEYIVNTGIDDELRRGDIIGFVRRYNGPLYARNNYHIKLPRAIERFEKQKVNCREIEGQVVAAMPGLRDPNPAAEGFANTGFDERYLKSFDAEDENTGLVPNPFKEYQAEQASATASVTDGDPGPAAVEKQQSEQSSSDPQEAIQSLPTQNAEVIVNAGENATPPPQEFVPENKVMEAPPKDGAVATTTETSILGVAVPAGLYAFFKGLQEYAEKGVIDMKEIVSALLDLIRNNVKYVAILIFLIVGIVLVKKAFKQVTFLAQMFINANPNWHNIQIVPTTVEHKRWWQFWK